MRYCRAFIVLLIMFALSGSLIWPAVGGLAHADTHGKRANISEVERAIAADPNVSVSICLISGDLSVHGWDRNQIRVRAVDADELEFRRPAGVGDSDPAKEVTVLAANKMRRAVGSCLVDGNVELDVPRGSTVRLRTRDGEIQANDVAMVYADTQGGNVDLRDVKRSVEATSIGGNLTLTNSRGSVKLRSVGGTIQVRGTGQATADDICNANSVGGDIRLDAAGYSILRANTVGGSVSVNGPLARGGRYDFKTMSGDLELSLPADVSFRFDARFSRSSDLVTDFPLTSSSLSSRGAGYGWQHVNGIYGTGDALINVSSFSGAIHIRRK
jgi:Putative adhesin